MDCNWRNWHELEVLWQLQLFSLAFTALIPLSIECKKRREAILLIAAYMI